MKIQTKLAIVLAFCFMLFVGTIFFFYITEKQGIETIFKIDAKNTEEVFDRVNSIVGGSLETFVYDYTYWDEMVAFMRTGNKAWAEVNIDASLSTYKANAVWLYGLDKNIFYAAQDIKDSFYNLMPIPSSEISKLFDKSAFCHFFVNTQRGIMEIRGATIHPSEDKERKMPAVGYFFAGRLWDNLFLKNLSEASGTNVVIGPKLTASPAKMNIKKGALIFFRALPSWNGLPVSTLKIEAESKIVPAFNAFTRTMLFMLVGFSIAIFLIIIASLVLWVITPLKIILRALFKEDSSCLDRLAHKEDELGRIANLIENFFQQRRQLIDEIVTRKQAEEDLRKEKEFSEGIINTAQVILLLLDPEGRIITFNPYTEQLLGYREEIVRGGDWCDIFLPKETRGATRKLFSDAISGIQTKGNVTTIIAKDGHKFQIEWYDKTIRGSDGNVEGLLAIGIDVTERKKMEEEARKRFQELEVFYKSSMGREERILELKKEIERLKKEMGASSGVRPGAADDVFKQQAQELGAALKEEFKSREILISMLADNNQVREKLEESLEKLKEAQTQLIHAEKMEAIGTMASGVAHEVKNPLAIILQGINYLEKILPLNVNDNHEILQMMKDAVRRADRIVRSLLDFSRGREFKKELCYINSVIENSLDLVAHNLKPRGIELICEFGDSLPRVLIDAGKIEQVFVNLFNNAADAMPRGGKLYVRSYVSKMKEMIGKVIGKEKDIFKLGEEVVIVEIEDTGTGIDEDIMDNIFDPFFTTKDRADGTGLGLSVVKNIIDTHRGLISVKSKNGKGAKFTIVFKISMGG